MGSSTARLMRPRRGDGWHQDAGLPGFGLSDDVGLLLKEVTRRLGEAKEEDERRR